MTAVNAEYAILFGQPYNETMYQRHLEKPADCKQCIYKHWRFCPCKKCRGEKE